MKTLGEFIVEKQAEYPNAKGALTGFFHPFDWLPN